MQCGSVLATNLNVLPGQVLIPRDGRIYFPYRYLGQVGEILYVGIHAEHSFFPPSLNLDGISICVQ